MFTQLLLSAMLKLQQCLINQTVFVA